MTDSVREMVEDTFVSSSEPSEAADTTGFTTPDGIDRVFKPKKRAVVVGFGMVGIAFVEKLLKYDLESGRDEWEVAVFGEEPHIAYNRVGLTQYFSHRSIENLHLNPLEWYSSFAKGKLTYHTSDAVVFHRCQVEIHYDCEGSGLPLR